MRMFGAKKNIAILPILGILLLAVLAALPVRAAIPLRVGLAGDEDGIRRLAAAAFRTRVESLARGRIHVSIAGPALWGYAGASELELVRAVMAGDPPLALVSSATLSNFLPSLDVLDAPYFFHSREQVVRVLYGPSGRALLDSLQPRGLIGLAYVGPTFRGLLGRALIPESFDLRGLRMATVQSASAAPFVEALGGEAVPAPLGRLSGMTRQGFVDGADIDLCSAGTSGLLEVMPYAVDTRHAVTTSVLIANVRFLSELSPPERLALWDGAIAAIAAADAEVARATAAWQSRLAAAGRYRTLTPAQRTSLEARSSDARRTVLSRIDATFMRDLER